MSTEIWVAIIGAIALIAAPAIKHFVQLRESRMQGVKSEDVQTQPPAPDPSGGLIDRLERRLDKVEARLAVVEEELTTERTLKWLLVRYAQTLLDHFSRALGTQGAPAPPDPIRHYFPSHFPSREDSS
ncbi:hypothetical protein [Brachybacterium sp.]|uniref:hypothetical protein n=1 Tax=Brachybacterium sp. TaxID=1891286 RepID=UPI002ED3F681